MSKFDDSDLPSPLAVRESFPGAYYDGKTSARQVVSVAISDKHVVLQGDGWSTKLAASDTCLAAPSWHGLLLLSFADGSRCEFLHSPRLHQQLRQAGVAVEQMSWFASVLEGDWRLAVLSLAFLVAAVAAFYVLLLPSVAQFGATLVPAPIQSRLGNTVLNQLDARWFRPSGLPTTQQENIRQRFDQLLGARASLYRLHIRKSRIGPNAFALPGNIVVLTDELVMLVAGDLDTITGVLAHELGHVAHRHALRTVIQASALTILGSALIGDYSSVLAALPVTLGQLRYSRSFEAEADTYSRLLMCAKGIDPTKTALFFDQVSAVPGNLAEILPDYLKTHPGALKRAEFFRSGC